MAYNVFSGSGKGPDIFGTEPYHFYIRNLLLNFNIWFLLALASAPVLCLQYVFGQTQSKFTLLRSFFFVAPFYMWLAIFSLQPHKEERFMYPAYPFLGMNAALSLHAVLGSVGTTDPRRIISKIPAKLKLLIVSTVLLASIEAGLLRTIGVMTAYRAPLQIYSSLPSSSTTESGRFVCLGKEWYRFPSSYSLPNGLRAKFIRSEFDGLLPGEFSEAKTGFGLFPGTWLIPSGMNDRNIADPGKYVSLNIEPFLEVLLTGVD